MLWVWVGVHLVLVLLVLVLVMCLCLWRVWLSCCGRLCLWVLVLWRLAFVFFTTLPCVHLIDCLWCGGCCVLSTTTTSLHLDYKGQFLSTYLPCTKAGTQWGGGMW